MKKYKIVENVSAKEEDQLGYYGVMLLNLIKKNKELYEEYKAENSLIDSIQYAEQKYIKDMDALIADGLNESTAREICWPEITAMLGVYK